MDYPENFLRGLSADDCVSDGIPTAAAFQFHFEPDLMKDGCATNSIGWEDDGNVVDLLMKQQKDGQTQFKAGLARFKRDSIDHIMKLPTYRGILSYDRQPLEGNQYHGNILVSNTSTKYQRRVIPGVIASLFTEIIPRT